MSTASVVRRVVPRDGLPTERQLGGHEVGALLRKGPARARVTDEDHGAAEENARCAPWFDAAVAAYPSAASYEEEGGIDKSDLSNMRSGKRSVALRRLLPAQAHAPSALAFCAAFLHEVEIGPEHAESVLFLVAPLLESIGCVARPKKALSELTLALMVLRKLNDGSAVTRRLIDNIAAEEGHGHEEVSAALCGQGGVEP